MRTDVKDEKGNGTNAAQHHPSSDEVLISSILLDDKASESESGGPTAVGTFSDGSEVEEVGDEEEEVGSSGSAEVREVGGGPVIGGEKVAEARATQPAGETTQAEYSTTQAYESTQDGFGNLGKDETMESEFSETEENATESNEATTEQELTDEEIESNVESIEDNSERENPFPASRRDSREIVMPVFISEEVLRPYQRHFQRPYQAISEEVVAPTLMSTVFLPPNDHFMLR